MNEITPTAGADQVKTSNSPGPQPGSITRVEHGQDIGTPTKDAEMSAPHQVRETVVPSKALGIYTTGHQQQAARIVNATNEVLDAVDRGEPRYEELCYRFIEVTRNAKHERSAQVWTRDVAYLCVGLAFVGLVTEHEVQWGYGVIAAAATVTSITRGETAQQYIAVREDCKVALSERFGAEFVDELSTLKMNPRDMQKAINMLKARGLEESSLSVIDNKLDQWDPDKDPPVLHDWLADVAHMIHPEPKPATPRS